MPKTDLTQDEAAALARLTARLNDLTRENCALAFSGGTDSSLLLYLLSGLSQKHGTRVVPLFAKTSLQAHGESSEAARFCEGLQLKLTEVEVDDLSAIAHNPVNRCYLCKHQLFTALWAKARTLKCSCLLDGTNADDHKVYRPGLKALAELKVISPLFDCNITKAEVRALLASFGLPTARKPSAPCLATRCAYGMELDLKVLEKLGKAEQELRSLGFYNVRLRVHPGSVARLEVDAADLPRLLTLREQVIELVKGCGLNYVTLDLQGFRSGSMDELLTSAERA